MRKNNQTMKSYCDNQLVFPLENEDLFTFIKKHQQITGLEQRYLIRRDGNLLGCEI